MNDPIEKAAPATARPATIEIGVSGLRHSGGYLMQEFLRDLQGPRARRIYRDMASNDPTVGAALAVVELLIKAAGYAVDPHPTEDSAGETQAAEIAEFYRQVFDDMSHSFTDFLSECLTMLVYGWAFHEIVLKKRDAVDHADPRRRSKYPDGLFGIRKLAPRAQMTLLRWVIQPDGGLVAMVQRDPNSQAELTIPFAKGLLFRTTSRENSPEGVSMLRNCYRPWLFLQRIQESEAIGIERELAGLPVVYVPQSVMTGTDADNRAALNAYKKLVRDIRFNSQAGVVLPSDPWKQEDGSLSTVRRVAFELVKGGGQRTVDTVSVKRGYQADILRRFLSDFLMLGQQGSGGSYNLGENRNDLFVQAVYSIVAAVFDPINRILVPRLGAINGFPPDLLPTVRPERIAPLNLSTLGAFVRDLSLAGASVFPDDDLENHLRAEADLPPKQDQTAPGAVPADLARIVDEAISARSQAATQQDDKTPPPEGT